MVKNTKLTFLFLLLTNLIFAQTVINSDVGGFKIKFPGDVETVEDVKDYGVTYKYSCSLDENTFFAACTSHEVELDDSYLQISMDAFVSSAGATKGEQTAWAVGKKNGLRAEMTLESPEATTIWYGVIIADTRQIQVVYASKDSNFNEKAAKKFFKSFKLVK